MSTTYTLTAAEAASYDSDDHERMSKLRRSLRARFGRVAGGEPVSTEVCHPDGYVVEAYSGA